MQTFVSRLTIVDGKAFVDGKPACSRCGRRPQRWDGRRWQSHCTECHREYNAGRRAGKVEMPLTPQERAGVVQARVARAAAAAEIPAPGRHRR